MRAWLGNRLLERLAELLRGFHAPRRDAEPGPEPDEIDVWISELEQGLRSITRSRLVHAVKLGAQDRVTAVVEDHDRDVELFARHRPERLDGVLSRAVRLECDDGPVGARDRRAHSDREPLTDGTTGQSEPVVPRAPGGVGRQGGR